MKIILCGPPHSGKSVFLNNLMHRLPTDEGITISGCPDGEGPWSSNNGKWSSDGEREVVLVRNKGKFSKNFVKHICAQIDCQSDKIVIVDVGGIISKENEEIFKHCDSFIVISSDEKKKEEWLKFGKKLGLNCIGALDSRLEGEEKIYTEEPYIQGKIVGLERGKFLEKSKLLDSLTLYIIKESKYQPKEVGSSSALEESIIDETELASELGYLRKLENGGQQVRWTEESTKKVYEAIKEKVRGHKEIKLFGLRANFIVATAIMACKNGGVEEINLYDDRNIEGYVNIKKLPKKRTDKSKNLKYRMIESKDSIFLDVGHDGVISLDDYKKGKINLPKINENKILYLSGKLPHWMLASILTSYDSKRIYTFQPGNRFTCITSPDETEIGKTVDNIPGIDVERFYEDDKLAKEQRKIEEKNRENKENKDMHPIIAKKSTIFSKVKDVFNWYKEKKKNSKYVDETIIAMTLFPKQQDTTNVSTNEERQEFIEKLQVNNKDKKTENGTKVESKNGDLSSDKLESKIVSNDSKQEKTTISNGDAQSPNSNPKKTGTTPNGGSIIGTDERNI